MWGWTYSRKIVQTLGPAALENKHGKICVYNSTSNWDILILYFLKKKIKSDAVIVDGQGRRWFGSGAAKFIFTPSKYIDQSEGESYCILILDYTNHDIFMPVSNLPRYNFLDRITINKFLQRYNNKPKFYKVLPVQNIAAFFLAVVFLAKLYKIYCLFYYIK